MMIILRIHHSSGSFYRKAIGNSMVIRSVSCFRCVWNTKNVFDHCRVQDILAEKNILKGFHHWMAHYIFKLIFFIFFYSLEVLHLFVILINVMFFFVTIGIVGWMVVLCFCYSNYFCRNNRPKFYYFATNLWC